MQRRIRVAIVLLSLAGVVGVWLVLAPFVAPGVDSYQPVGAVWTTATMHHVITGTVLAVGSVVAALTLVATAVRSLPWAASAETVPIDDGE